MRKSRFVQLALRAGIAVGLFSVQFLAATLPAGANTGPPTAILIHEVEYELYDPCVPQVTECHQIVRNTSVSGLLSFQFFLYPQYHADMDLNHLTVALTWPETWYPYDWQTCGGGVSNWSWDGSVWVLDVSWPECPTPGTLFLVGTMVMNVGGPGRLDFAHSGYDGEHAATVAYWCPPVWWDYSTIGACAVAGTECEYTNYQCGDRERCIPRLDQAELHLTTSVGGVVKGDVGFSLLETGWCAPGLNIYATWLTAAINPVGGERYRLDVTANAKNLAPGRYQAWVQVVGYPDRAARCVLVTLDVQETSSVPEPSGVGTWTWGRVKATFR